MKKVSDTQAKTPSGTTKTEEILDDISVLVGQISKAEDLCVSNLETLSSAIDAKLLETIVHNTEALVEFSFTQSNMIMGIAGYLLGDKGINSTTNTASLLGKIKNNEPLFLGPTEGSKFYGDLLEEILAKYAATSTVADSGSGSNSGYGSGDATINVVLHSVDGGNLDSLIELIKELQKTGNVENIEVLTAIQGLMQKLNTLGNTEVDSELISKKMDDVQLAMFNIGETFNGLSDLERIIKGNKNIKVLTAIQSLINQLDALGKIEVDTELISKKMDDVQLAMFNIGETFNELSNLERRIKGVDIKVINTTFDTLSKFDFVGNLKNMEQLIDFINDVAQLKVPKNINKNILENTNRITEFIKVLVPFYSEMEKVPRVNYKALIKNITNNVNKLPMLVDALNGIELKEFNKTKLKELYSFREAVHSFLCVLNLITFENIDIGDALDVFKDDILPYFEGKDGLVSRMSGLDLKKFDDSTTKDMMNLSFMIGSFGEVLKAISKLTPTMMWLTMAEDDVFNGVDLVYNMTYWLQQIVDQMKAVNKNAGVFVTFNGVMTTLVDIFKSLFKFSIFAMAAVGMSKHINTGIDILNLISTKLENLNVSDIKDKQEIVHSYKLFIDDLLSVLAKVPLIGILGFLAVVFEKPLIKAIGTLNKIITTINENIQVPELNASIENLKPYATLMKDLLIVFGAVTLVGILSAPAIIGGLILAAAVKVVFVVLSKSFESIKANVIDKKTHEALDSMARLIFIIGGLMIVAALVGVLVIKFFVNIMAFLEVFLIFLASITVVISAIGGLMQLMNAVDAVKTMTTLGNFIQTLAIIMIVGALFMLTGLWKESLLFGAVLAGFIFTILIPFVLLGSFFKTAIAGAKEIATLVVTCTLVMMLGALFMLTGLHLHALGFGVLLAAFIALVIAPFIWLIKSGGRKALKAVDDIKQLVITCTIILVLGALLMMIPGFAENAIWFGVILVGFVFLIVGTFALLGKHIEKALGALYGVMLMMVVSTLVLIMGSQYIAAYGWEDIAIFGTTLVTFIGVIGGAAWLLGKMEKSLMKGLLAMAVIVGISMLFGITLKMIANAVNLADPLTMLEAVGVIAAIILAVGGLSVALGALATIPPTSLFFWAGIGACAAVAGIAVVLSVAIKNIAEAAKMMAEASNMGFNVDNALSLVGGMVKVGEAVGAAGVSLPLPLIKATSSACLSMAIMISKIGKAVGEISNLNVAIEWDSEGNPIKFRQLNQSDFQKAADNTKTIISVLGDAIIEIYNKKPELFKAPVITSKSWFRTTQKQGKTPFEIVCTACASMGNMISLVAKGVADMADLKVAVAWSSDGTPTKYRHLQESDFKLAADNISKIISTLGTAIIGVYEQNPDLFKVPMITEKTWWGGTRTVSDTSGKTVFEKVVTACSSMGNMITLIAQSVRDFATMSYPSKWNSDGVPIAYSKLTDGDIKNAISNIYKTILCTFDALMRVYNWDPAFFDTKVEFQDGFIVAKNPVFSVIRAGTAMGRMISSIAQGVADIANLRIATKWNKDGVPIDFRPFKQADFNAYEVNVNKILTATINAVKAAYDIDPKLFDSIKVNINGDHSSIEYTEDSPIKSVVTACQGLGVVISEIAKGVSDVINLNLIDADGKKVPLDPADIEPDKGKFYILTRNILCSIPRAMKQAYDLCPDGTTDAINYFNDRKDKIKDIVAVYAGHVKEAKDKITDIDDFDNNIDDSQLFKRIFRIIACLPRAIQFAYSACPDGTAEAIKYFNNLKDKVKDLVSPYVDCVKDAKDKTADIDDFDNNIDDSALFKRIFRIIACLPRAIQFAYRACPDGTAEAIKYFTNLEDNIKDIVTAYVDCVKDVKDKTKDIIDFDNNIDDSALFKRIFRIIACLPRAIKFAYDICPDGTTEAINYFNDRKSKVNYIITAYTEYVKDVKDKVATITDFDNGIDNSLLFNRIKAIIASIPRATKFAYDACPEGTAKSIDYFNNLKGNLNEIVAYYTSLYTTLNSTISENSVDETNKTWMSLVTGITVPFVIQSDKGIKNIKAFDKLSFDGTKKLIKSVNSLNSDKVDKFIELTEQLRDLSLNVEGMSGFIEALNGKINDTLNTVSERLIESTKALQKSDEAHTKRNEIIKKNTAELKKVLETPMKVNVVTTTEGSTETSFADANIGGSDGLSGLTSGTPSISEGTPVSSISSGTAPLSTSTPVSSGTPTGSTDLLGSTSTQSGTPIDNSTLTSIAGTTADILAALRELLEKQ